MKTHIIQLDSYDDATSVRDKMAWGKSARILLVWPETDPHVLNRKLDLVLLRRRAQELGSQLAFVSKDKDVRYYAEKLNIPIFRDITRAQTARWLQRKRGLSLAEGDLRPETRLDLRSFRPQNRRHQEQADWVRILALLAALFSILAVTGVLVPRARITLTPEVRTQSLTFNAVTGPNITGLNASGAIPARSLTVVVEGSLSVPSTGSTRIPSEPAAGFALFSNLTSEPVRVEAGTVVLTSGTPPVRYEVTTAGVLAGEPGATIILPVRAMLPGEDGNAQAGAIVAVEGLLGLQLSVTNPDPLSGGRSVRLAAPTELDRSLAAAELTESLRRTAAEELLSNLEESDLLLSELPVLVATHQESYLPAENAPSDILEANLRLEFKVLAIPWSEIELLARTVLDAGLEPGFEPDGSGIEIEFVTTPEADIEGSAEWQINAMRGIRSIPTAQEVFPDLLGRSMPEAVQLLAAANDLGAPPSINLSPAWWPRLPLLPIQIDVEIAYP